MTNPSDAQRPRDIWDEDELLDAGLFHGDNCPVLPQCVCGIGILRARIDALEADLGRAREANDAMGSKQCRAALVCPCHNRLRAALEAARVAEGKAALADEIRRAWAQWRPTGGTMHLEDWAARYDVLTPAADAPIAHSRSQAKRLTVQTGVEHIAAADAAEGGKG